MPFTCPANIQAEALSSSSVKLSWDSAGEGLSYKVYRHDASSGSYTLITTTPVTELYFTDTELTANTTYYYEVTTILKGSAESGKSPYISVTTLVDASITITLAQESDVTLNTTKASLIYGGTLTVTITPSTGFSCQWYLDGKTIPGATSASYTLSSKNMSVGVYELMVKATKNDQQFSGRCTVSVVLHNANS
jgi:hypothetical protein